jgi:hypothetical protein
VRTAVTADAPAIRTLLARAYQEDPLLAWVFPDEATRPEATAAWLGTFVDRYLPAGRVTVVDDGPKIAGVAIWRWPGHSGPRMSAPSSTRSACCGPAGRTLTCISWP